MCLEPVVECESYLRNLLEFSRLWQEIIVATLATLPKPVTEYQRLSPEELFARTTAAKTTLGDRVMVLGHNYQRDEVIQHAEFRGDSLLLSKIDRKSVG